MINSIGTDIGRYKSVLKHSLSKVDKILTSNIDIKIGSNKSINKAEVYHIRLTKSQSTAVSEIHSIKSWDSSVKDTETILPIDNQKMFPEEHNDKKLAMEILLGGMGRMHIIFGRSWWIVA